MNTQEAWKESFIAPNVQKLMEKRKESEKKARKAPLVLLDLRAHLVHKVHLEYQGSQEFRAATPWVPLAHLALLGHKDHLDHRDHLDLRDIQVVRKPNTERHSQLWCIFKVKKPLSK